VTLSSRQGAEEAKHGAENKQGTLATLHRAQPPGHGHFGVNGPLGQSGQSGPQGVLPWSRGASGAAAGRPLSFAQRQQDAHAHSSVGTAAE
jgi:hypothetical protein